MSMELLLPFNKTIRWPADCANVAQNFYCKARIPTVIGCIDVSLIPVAHIQKLEKFSSRGSKPTITKLDDDKSVANIQKITKLFTTGSKST
uniref:Uncharacterized protein n=1 Tax=Romanomermis culicivorax TaxID=13658 RepID=A0A915IMS5_ROMCU